MAEFTANAIQLVEVNQNVLFSDTPVNPTKCIKHREGSGIVTLKGMTNGCFARFFVAFNSNIAIPTDGTAPEEISLSIAIDGEPLSSTRMRVTPADVDNYFNISASAYIDVPVGCCSKVSVENTSAQNINVQDANLLVIRTA